MPILDFWRVVMKVYKPIAVVLSAVMAASVIPTFWFEQVSADVVQSGWGIYTGQDDDKNITVGFNMTEHWELLSNGVLEYELGTQLTKKYEVPDEDEDPLDYYVDNVMDKVTEIRITSDYEYAEDDIFYMITDMGYDHFIQWGHIGERDEKGKITGDFGFMPYENVKKIVIDGSCFFSPTYFPNAEVEVNKQSGLVLNWDMDFDENGSKLNITKGIDNIVSLEIYGENKADWSITSDFISKFTKLSYLFADGLRAPEGLTIPPYVTYASLHTWNTPSLTLAEGFSGYVEWYPDYSGDIAIYLPSSKHGWNIDCADNVGTIDMYFNGTEADFNKTYPEFHYYGNWRFHYTDSADPKAQIIAFAERIYTYVLNREPDESGVKYWSDELYNFNRTGAEVAQGFIFSEEFINRKTNDQEFIKILYQTFFGREADTDGMNYWLGQLSSGAMDRTAVANGFIFSQEWANTCASYGIRSGGDVKPSTTIKPTDLTYGFVERMYTTAMGRAYDEEGRKYWAAELANFNITGEQVGASFFLSDEMKGYNLSDQEYLNRLYLTFMNREADADGSAYWLGVLNSGTTREEVVYGFTRSPEFTAKCVEARILPF